MRDATNYNCEKCDHRYCGKDVPGSNGDAPYYKWTFNGEKFKSCPLPMITELSDFYLRMFKHHQHSILLVSGGLLDQPNKYLEAMEIIG
jgi:hypothetical protein